MLYLYKHSIFKENVLLDFPHLDLSVMESVSSRAQSCISIVFLFTKKSTLQHLNVKCSSFWLPSVSCEVSPCFWGAEAAEAGH